MLGLLFRFQCRRHLLVLIHVNFDRIPELRSNELGLLLLESFSMCSDVNICGLEVHHMGHAGQSCDLTSVVDLIIDCSS